MQVLNNENILQLVLTERGLIQEDTQLFLEKICNLAKELILEQEYLKAKVLLEESIRLSKSLGNKEMEIGCKTVHEGLMSIINKKDGSIDPQKTFYLRLIENYLSKNMKREALYYLEDLLSYLKINYPKESGAEVITQMGKLLTESNKYEDSLSFYRFVFEGRSRYLDFGCQTTGDCCKEFVVNVNLNDIRRIMKNKPEMKVEDLIYFQDKSFIKDFQKNKSTSFLFQDYNEPFLYLKKKNNVKECIFLLNGLCSINDYKPGLCKLWPMVLNDDNNIVYGHANFLKDKCGYCVTPGDKDEEKTKKELREDLNERYVQDLIKNKMMKNIVKNSSEYFSDPGVMEKFINLSEIYDQYLDLIRDSLAENENVIKIISTFKAKEEIKKTTMTTESGILVYCKKGMTEIGKQLLEKLKTNPNVDLIKIVNGENDLKIIFSPSFVFRIVLLPVTKIRSVPYKDEKIIYLDSNYHFPEVKKEIKIPADPEVYRLLVKVSLRVLKHNLKNLNLAEGQKVINNLLILNENTSENEELNDIVLKAFQKVQEYYLTILTDLVKSENIDPEKKAKAEVVLNQFKNQ